MKYFFFVIGMLLVMIPSVHAQLTDDEKTSNFGKNSNELLIMPDLYNIHNTIVCGTVIGKDPDKITPRPEYSSYMEGSSYSIKVEKYFKNPNSNATIDALGSEDSNGPKSMLPFEIGQIGLFYIDKIDEKINTLSLDSIKVKTCKSIHLVSPLKQFKSGISSDKIQCKESSVLVTKYDGSPVCVKPESIGKLLQRGWLQKISTVNLAVPRGDYTFKPSLTVEGLNETYSVGQKIEFTVKFNGTGYDCGYPQLRIEDSNHDIIWENSGVVSLCDPDMKKIHIEKKWIINDSTHFGIPVIDKGGYYTLFVTFSDDIIQKDFVVRW
ncbi:MAG: hypothetical protein EPO37_01190 [Nitrosarchaeum sp.]|nr:MAG: hypothetical protein EPO37_01190 [Nitrosarchaeum sp.]